MLDAIKQWAMSGDVLHSFLRKSQAGGGERQKSGSVKGRMLHQRENYN